VLERVEQVVTKREQAFEMRHTESTIAQAELYAVSPTTSSKSKSKRST